MLQRTSSFRLLRFTKYRFDPAR